MDFNVGVFSAREYVSRAKKACAFILLVSTPTPPELKNIRVKSYLKVGFSRR